MDIEDKIKIIIRQTNYSEKEANEKLVFHNIDHIKVIKEYLGVPDKKQEKKSLNQEIYKEIRIKLDESTREYNKSQEKTL